MTHQHQFPRPAGAAGAGVSWPSAIARGLWTCNIRELVHVPDNPLSAIMEAVTGRYPGIRTTAATREEEAVGIAAGLYLGGARPGVLMQSSGLGNALNALASLLIAYQIPVVLVLSMRGDPGEWNWAQVPLGRAVPRLLEAIGVPAVTVDRPEAAEECVRLASRLAFDARVPAACLLPRRLTAPVVEEKAS